MVGDVGLKGLGEFRSAGSSIPGERNTTKGQHHFRYERPVQRDSGGSISCSTGRMSMHNGMDIGTQFVNEQMHGDFGGNLATSVESQAIHVNDHEIVFRHVTFTDGCWCCENGAIVQPDADVPIIS